MVENYTSRPALTDGPGRVEGKEDGEQHHSQTCAQTHPHYPPTYRALSIVESQPLVPPADPFLHVWDHVLQEPQEIIFIAQLLKFAAFLVSAHHESCCSKCLQNSDCHSSGMEETALLSHADLFDTS